MASPASVERGAAPHDGMPPAVKELAAALLPSARELAQALADHLATTVPELAAVDDDDLREETRASSEANVDQVLRLLRAGAAEGRAVIMVTHETAAAEAADRVLTLRDGRLIP